MDIRHPAFFVFGPERSGTTLLTFLLSGQPTLFVLNDSFVFDRYVEWTLLRAAPGDLPKLRRLSRLATGLAPSLRLRDLGGLRDWRRPYHAARGRHALRLDAEEVVSPAEIRGYHDLLKARYLLSLAHQRSSFLNEYVNGLPQPPENGCTRKDLLSHTIASVSGLFVDPADSMLGEKTPIHTAYAEWILRLYPHAKALAMVRHPVANVASIFKRYGDFERSVEAYSVYAAALVELSESSRVMTVRHEDLVSSTSRTVEAILRFLDPALPFDAACPVNSYTKSEYTGGAVDVSRLETASDALSPRQQREIRARFSEVERRFYE